MKITFKPQPVSRLGNGGYATFVKSAQPKPVR